MNLIERTFSSLMKMKKTSGLINFAVHFTVEHSRLHFYNLNFILKHYWKGRRKMEFHATRYTISYRGLSYKNYILHWI